MGIEVIYNADLFEGPEESKGRKCKRCCKVAPMLNAVTCMYRKIMKKYRHGTSSNGSLDVGLSVGFEGSSYYYFAEFGI